MKLNEKMTLFLIATFTVFIGITDNLIKGTESKLTENADDNFVIETKTGGLTNIIINNSYFGFKSDIFMYDIAVDNLEKLSIMPVLSNDYVEYTIDIIGDRHLDNSLIAIISVNSNAKDRLVYTLYIAEKN